jgi:hypothetical protein
MLLLMLLLAGSILLAVKARNFKAKTSSVKDRDRTDTKKMPQKLKNGLTPILLPHPDTAFLIEFVSDGCDMCAQMRPVVERLEDDLGTKVRRISIQRRNEFIALLEAVGFDEGGNFPFYYNRRSGQAICGATTYMNLRRWGMGNLNHLFNDPPQTLQSQIEESKSYLSKNSVVFIPSVFF